MHAGGRRQDGDPTKRVQHQQISVPSHDNVCAVVRRGLEELVALGLQFRRRLPITRLRGLPMISSVSSTTAVQQTMPDSSSPRKQRDRQPPREHHESEPADESTPPATDAKPLVGTRFSATA